ncbi:MAG: glycosyltransferase [Deltaproteobacteria bacterium]|nr:glycosyltransferase [Deltaproteobacteria bacterium]
MRTIKKADSTSNPAATYPLSALPKNDTAVRPRCSKLNPLNLIRLYLDARLLAKSGYFDRAYYLAANPDLARLKFPLLHYLMRGGREGRAPGPNFDSRYYLEHNCDVAQRACNPLVHYLRFGRSEGRHPFPGALSQAERELIIQSGIFDAEYYTDRYPDVAASNLSALEHFLRFGLAAKRDPSPRFDTHFYYMRYPDLAGYGKPVLLHYLEHGRREGRECLLRENLPDAAAVEQAQRQLNFSEPEIFSIVMATWNRREQIVDAIKSVQAQSYRRWELIVADDGSEDGTPAMLRELFAAELNNGRLKILELPHQGVSAARNAALRVSTGKWVTYLDSDNTWREHYLLFCAAAFVSHPELKTAYSELCVHDTIKNFCFVRRAPFFWSRLKRANFIDLNIYAHHHSVYAKLGGFDQNMDRLVDWDMILRHTRHFPPFQIKYTLADYYLAPKLCNITLTADYDKNRDIILDKYR